MEKVLVERDRCAKLLEMSNSQILLMAGEMTPNELRTVKAVLKALVLKIREGDVETSPGLAEQMINNTFPSSFVLSVTAPSGIPTQGVLGSIHSIPGQVVETHADGYPCHICERFKEKPRQEK